jgi:hypothetical protein
VGIWNTAIFENGRLDVKHGGNDIDKKRSGSYGDNQSAWPRDNQIDGLLKQKVIKIIDAILNKIFKTHIQ